MLFSNRMVYNFFANKMSLFFGDIGVTLLVVGGISYTIGALFNMIFHILADIGSLLRFLYILFCVI